MKQQVLIAVFVAFSFSVADRAQENAPSSTSSSATTLPLTSRWELVQSPLLARLMFKLDKYTGETWQMVRDDEHGQSWKKMLIQDAPKVDKPILPRFQIFLSGMVVRCSYLLDSTTGRTWVLVGGNENANFSWQIVLDTPITSQ